MINKFQGHPERVLKATHNQQAGRSAGKSSAGRAALLCSMVVPETGSNKQAVQHCFIMSSSICSALLGQS
jgi:hypothetical protein